MDWEYFLSLSPEDLTEEEKDDLYNTVTWFNSDGEELDLKRSLVLIKISQEVLKYKGEQVEILLHKLDELATRQGEEDVKKIESDTDARSSRSRKSTSLEFENLEQKYLELKTKHKKLLKNNEKGLAEISKLQAKVSTLEGERDRLVGEIQTMSHDDNQSDVSEAVTDQQKQLAHILHNKNRQISDLLNDIEDAEKENIVLREKLSNVRDELSVATKELTSLTDTFKAHKIELDDRREIIKKLTAENETLQEENDEIQEQKRKFEQEMEEFTIEVNRRVDEWKSILDEKEKEISDLRLRQPQGSLHSSVLTLNDDLDHTQTLNKILVDRENQLVEVKTRLHEAVKEMEESTVLIKELTEEKEENDRRINELSETTKHLKKQVKVAHERCKKLQEELAAVEKIAQNKDDDMKEIVNQLKSEGGIDLAEKLEQLQEVKNENYLHEKKIMSLVRVANQLQFACDEFEKENEALKSRLGIKADEVVDTSGVSTKQKQQKKELDSLKKKLARFQEENLELKLRTRLKNRGTDVVDDVSEDIVTKKQIKALVEENEALRKGLHEILKSLNSRKETSLREIKSETFESLLRALDVKHISGWYHPAMRLQAEMHNLEGVNAELREQLRLTKLEVHSARSIESEGYHEDRATLEIVKDVSTMGNIRTIVDNLLKKTEDESEINCELENKIFCYKNDFVQIRDQLALLYREYINEKQSFIDKLSEYEEKMNDLEDFNKVQIEKVQLLSKDCGSEASLLSKSLELTENNVVLTRKCAFMNNQVTKLNEQITKLQEEMNETQKDSIRKACDFEKKNSRLKTEIEDLKSKIECSVNLETLELQKNFENLTIKYRDLLRDFERVSRDKEFEIKMFEKIRGNLEKEKGELQERLVEVLENLHNLEYSGENVEGLSRKLSESEVNEINERQRANHTNNLYELVKEQLQKCEDQLKISQKSNSDVIQKNMLLQEQLKDSENNLINFIDVATHKMLQTKYNELLQTCDKLNLEILGVNKEYSLNKKTLQLIKCWGSEKEQEFLSMQHLIVDLQAASDEKMQIARLSVELSNLRQQETENGEKIENLSLSLSESHREIEELSQKIEVNFSENLERENALKRKIGILKDLLSKAKIQYLGSLPLPTEEKIVNNIKQVMTDKHEAFLNVYNSQILMSEASTLKDQYDKDVLSLKEILKSKNPEEIEKIVLDFKQRKHLQFNETKYKRLLELKETQLSHVFDRVKIQDEQIISLEEELFALHKNVSFEIDVEAPRSPPKQETVKIPPPPVKLNRSREIQTDEILEENLSEDNSYGNLRAELINVSNEVISKEQAIEQLKSKITELEMNISLFRKQLGDKQSQITFYERHIVELQSKKEIASPPVERVEKTDNDAQIFTLKEIVKEKEDEILRYQTLLKDDRDKHSMAAALMREELKMLQKCLIEEKQKLADFKSSSGDSHPSKAALEQYFLQVHALEGELSELHTSVSSLESQLQASRREAVRWRTLANDRLESMQKLGKDLEDIHNNEIVAYKHEAEKWREEVTNLKHIVSQYRSEMGRDFDLQKIVKEKDDKVHELTVRLRQVKSEARKTVDKSESEVIPKLTELESAREHLEREHENLKRRFDQLLSRERSAREEIRELKGKLAKKPSLSARSDKSDRSIKEQLQKKISTLENENADLKRELTHQINLNESHRVKISEDFDRWNKQKQLQQTTEKLKSKLKAKEADFEKIRETCAGYRVLIERLEREKYNLENRIRSLKSGSFQSSLEEIEMLKLENLKLMSMNQALNSKLEMQQHHSGGLGAAMLQEKLEAQERKIAVLEMSSKGSLEVRAELERLQNTISTLQKSNLCLEAENLELKLDFEKSTKETPHLRDQIQHLETYIEVLKREKQEVPALEGDPRSDSKKNSELERTIFVLKRVVEKLQAENRRLLGSKRPYVERSCSADKLRRDHQRLKEQHCENLKNIKKMEQEIAALKANKPVDEAITGLSDELALVKEQLEQKTHLLDKVKGLLQHAAIKEKALLDEIGELKRRQQPAEKELE